MRHFIAIVLLILFGATQSFAAEPAAAKSKPGRKQGRLVGTWECVSEYPPAGVRIVKHFTSAHFTCVHYDRNTHTPKVTIGGTWTRDGDTYKEKVAFATDGHKHLRGKEFAFTMTIRRGEMKLKAANGSGIVVDEVWKKLKADDTAPVAPARSDARAEIPIVPAVKSGRSQADAIQEALRTDRPLVNGADRILIQSADPPGRGIKIRDAEVVNQFAAALQIEAVQPSAGERAATINFYRDDELLRTVWIYHGGEWGFQRIGTSWTMGRSPELWRLVQHYLQRPR